MRYLLALVLGSFMLTVKAVTPKLIETVYSYDGVQVVQFEDKGLAHFSYAIITKGQMILVDPARNPQQYYYWADSLGLAITGVIETHPHADFVSSHLQIAEERGAVIYVGSLVGAAYLHQTFDHGDVIQLSETVELRAIFTPGHSPDGISIVLVVNGKDVVVFTGDTLFVGDVGRPDLREQAGNIKAKKLELAKAMYRSLREELMTLEDDVVVLPAHGSGSLCGKALGDAQWSTIGQEKQQNPAMQEMSEEVFVEWLLADQPFVPLYFPYSVELNKNGAPAFLPLMESIGYLPDNARTPKGALLIDTRSPEAFRKSHREGAINIPDGGKFETWLGTVIGPEERFYLLAENKEALLRVLHKSSKIGYELLVDGAMVFDSPGEEQFIETDTASFLKNPDAFTIIDVRTSSESAGKEVFEEAMLIPMHTFRERLADIPLDRPVILHCASGYRSAIAASILKKEKPEATVLDLGPYIKDLLKR